MISNKFKIILGVILLFGIIALWFSHRWYEDLDNYTNLENYSLFLKEEFPEVEHISTGSLQTLIKSRDAGVEQLLLIDCRKPEEFAVSHLPGAINLQTTDEVKAHLTENTDPPPIAIYCSVGYRSAALATELKAINLEAKNVLGSIFGWANENRPLVNNEGVEVDKVHPYNQFWRRHLDAGKSIELPE